MLMRRIDPNGQNTTNTTNQAELAGLQDWLKQLSQLKSPPATTFKLLTDCQLMLQSVQKGIIGKQRATIWLCTPEPLLMDIVASPKAQLRLSEAGPHVLLGNVKAHTRGEGNVLAEALAAAKHLQLPGWHPRADSLTHAWAHVD